MQPYKIRVRCSYMYIVNFSNSKPCILKVYLNNRLSMITILKIGVQIFKKNMFVNALYENIIFTHEY